MRTKHARLPVLGSLRDGEHLRVAGVAVLVTVSLASIGSSYYSTLTERVLITPVAMIIGDDWPKALRSIVRLIFRVVDLARGGGKGDAP